MAERKKAPVDEQPVDEHLAETRALLEELDSLIARIRARIFKLENSKPTLVPKTGDADDTKK